MEFEPTVLWLGNLHRVTALKLLRGGNISENSPIGDREGKILGILNFGEFSPSPRQLYTALTWLIMFIADFPGWQ